MELVIAFMHNSMPFIGIQFWHQLWSCHCWVDLEKQNKTDHLNLSFCWQYNVYE